MQLHQLEYVLAVSKYGSFTRAAEKIKVSQSSISQQIIALEHELGIDLFHRAKRSVSLTPAGQDFVTHAMIIMSEVSSAYQCIQEYISADKGHIKIGIIPVIGYYPIPKLFANFRKDFPGIALDLIEYQDEELLIMLDSSDLDAALVQHYIPDSAFQFLPLYNDKMVLLTNKEKPFACKKTIDIIDLKNEKFILTPRASGHHHDFIRACQFAGFEPKIQLTCSAVETMLALTSEDIGVTVLSSRVAKSMPLDPRLAIIELTPTIERKIFLATQLNANVSPALKLFARYTAQWINLCD